MSPFTRPASPPGEERFRLAMAASGIGMAIVDLDRCWIEVNPAFERMLGYRAAELLGRPAAEFTHADDLDRSAAAIDDLLAGRIDTIDAAKRYRHRDGHTVWTHANVAVMRDPGGAPLYLLVQLRDITAERMAQERLRALDDEHQLALDASQRQLQLFADAVAHDLRAPLRSIESFSALLAERHADQLDASGLDHLARIRNAAMRMSSLLAALGELSYVTRTELKSTQVDLSLLAEWVGAEQRDADPERAATIEVQPGLVAQGDERLLKVMFTRLMENAWKFSREKPQVSICVGGETRGGSMRMWVRDAGSGFDMRYAHKLFQPFQRLHGPDEGGGHGLGLAIAKRVIERHHGTLRADSAPGEGSTFHVEWPAVPAHRNHT
ncbi:sensor histidine kinase [Montanilutibacter psychrotolerans]|uniref:histidine kinase n=1 Tax=Montanilutibacter psychrotolerans TaxID=1327343 RepID=A0A3M8SWT3_9GAMM|nr:PAS domain S-box protein [Lysobacter psychrotolerans]RNF83674.1 PAS domain S-box protein [Lysobacter psychrotolerans]